VFIWNIFSGFVPRKIWQSFTFEGVAVVELERLDPVRHLLVQG
jgi:hypothetical protein